MQPKLIGKTSMALSSDELKSLCDFDSLTNTYVSKSGQAYADALKALFYPDDDGNKNDKPFLLEDIITQPTYQDFRIRFKALDEFAFICKLKAIPMKLNSNGEIIKNGRKKSKEEIQAFDFVSDVTKSVFYKSVGVAYIITCLIDGVEYIIKIGQTGGTFEDRLGSYNCGYVTNWRTASTTNIKIVQSFVATRLEYRLYLRDCGDLAKPVRWAGRKTDTPIASPLPEAIESICLKVFAKKYNGAKPLANIQTNKQTK